MNQDTSQASPGRVTRRPVLIAASCLAAALLGACDKAAPPAPPPPLVDVITVTGRDVPVYREWIGVTSGDVNATIRPQVTGYLIKQNYREGDAVKKGQVLFEIDPRTFQAAVDQAVATRNQMQAKYVTAAASLARVRPLAEKNAVSQKDLDDATGADLSARAALDQSIAALESAQFNLAFTRITSPIDGVAGIAKAQIGDLLSPGATTELTTVSTLNPIKVLFNISEREYLDFAQKGLTARAETIPLSLTLVNGSTYPFTGRFSVLNRQVDTTTGTFKVEARFPNQNSLLRPGQFAKVRATMAVLKDALLVPQRAVTEIQGKYLVAVVGEGNKIDIRPVVPGERVDSDWIISSGLKAGEKIVVEGTQKVRPGSTVNPQPFAAPAAAAKSDAAKPPADAPAKGPAAAPKKG